MTTDAGPSTAEGSHGHPPLVESTSGEIERALHSSSHIGLRQVRCHYEDGVAILRGQVASFYLKQVAQTIVGQLSVVRQIRNELLVRRSDPS